MPLPISKQQLNKLGERIATSYPPAKEDLGLLNNVLRAYQDVLLTVEEQLSSIGLSATSRVKTRGVLIDKLRRERGMALARVQDMAGARTVIEGGWIEQDLIVEHLRVHFDAWTGKPSKVVDRRDKPSHGYRAVHVIVFPEGIPVEIQVRTELQNYWAQIVERLADRWGRGVRYGAAPEDAHRPAEGVSMPDGSPVTRQRIIDDLRNIAEKIGEIEHTEREFLIIKDRPAAMLDRRIIARFENEAPNLDAAAARLYPRLRSRFKRFVTGVSEASDRRRTGRFIRRTIPDIKSPDAEFVRNRLQVCNSLVDHLTDHAGSRLRQQQDSLRDTLHSLGIYVEQGGIR